MTYNSQTNNGSGRYCASSGTFGENDDCPNCGYSSRTNYTNNGLKGSHIGNYSGKSGAYVRLPQLKGGYS